LLIATGDDYPPGTDGDIAVCYFLPSEASWSFERAKDRAEAEVELTAILNGNDALIVVLKSGRQAGLPSRVAWIAKCDGMAWQRIKETAGAKQFMEPWE
jgi:hypothetical protein